MELCAKLCRRDSPQGMETGSLSSSKQIEQTVPAIPVYLPEAQNYEKL